jgi:hypothetical protein
MDVNGKSTGMDASRDLALAFRGVRLSADPDCPLLDLELGHGEAGLVFHPSRQAIGEIILIVSRLAIPLTGDVAWGPRASARSGGLWGNLIFNRGLGLVYRDMGLIHGRTVLEHLAIFLGYHQDLRGAPMLARSYRVLRDLGIHGRDWHEMRKVHSGRLPARLQRLGVYALAFVKEPWLYVLESPAKDLGPDFPAVWDAVERDRAEKGAAVLVLDSEGDDAYPGVSFQVTRTLVAAADASPDRPNDRKASMAPVAGDASRTPGGDMA